MSLMVLDAWTAGSAGTERLRGSAQENAQQLTKLRAEIHNKPSTPLDLTLFLVVPPSNRKQAWNSSCAADHMPHALQGWFGIQDFMTLVPTNYSQHFLNDEVRAPCLPWCNVFLCLLLMPHGWMSNAMPGLHPNDALMQLAGYLPTP